MVAIRSCLLLCGAVLLLAGRAAAAEDDVADYLGPRMPYAKFDALQTSTISVEGGAIVVGFASGLSGEREATAVAWIRQSAQAVSAYFGRFPVDRLRLLIVPVPGEGIHGTTWGERGAAIRITLGTGTSDSSVLNSWVLAHELVHLAQPELARQHGWFIEGMATYVEPLARAHGGLVSPEYVWRWFMWGMPNGLPKAGDQGLDRTHTWGRTYWGGALFCLLADIEIRVQTDGRRSLQDALRAVLRAGGNTRRLGLSSALATRPQGF